MIQVRFTRMSRDPSDDSDQLCTLQVHHHSAYSTGTPGETYRDNLIDAEIAELTAPVLGAHPDYDGLTVEGLVARLQNDLARADVSTLIEVSRLLGATSLR